jgi:predicted ArsR family transcriptional regulator
MTEDEIYDIVGGSRVLLKERLQRLEDRGLLLSHEAKRSGRIVRAYKMTNPGIVEYQKDNVKNDESQTK